MLRLVFLAKMLMNVEYLWSVERKELYLMNEDNEYKWLWIFTKVILFWIWNF